jgi:hypothetical protein
MFLLPLLLTLSIASVTGQSSVFGAEPQCACTFQVQAEEEPTCAVYGQDNSGELVDFDRISESCLAALAISERVLEVDRLFLICPYANETHVSVSNFMTYIQLYDTPTTNAIKSDPEFTQWFQTRDDGSVDIVDSITTSRGVTYDCTKNAPLCWNEIKIFFTTENYRVGLICEDLYEQQINALQTEQSMARSMVCEAAKSVVPKECKELKEKIESFMAANPDLQCSDLEARAAASLLPDTESCNAGARLIVDDGSGAAWTTGWVGITSWVILMGLLTFQE